MEYDNRPVGIFDSGVGGLTVASAVMKALPHEDIVYFGDTARVPYGSKSPDTITKFSKQIVHFLLSHHVKAIVVACNTVSSNSYEHLSASFDIPFIEVVTPGAKSCVEVTKNNIVGVIGTEMTVKSHAYENKLKAYNSQIKVCSKACPLFVPLAEEGWTDNQVALLTAEAYIEPMKAMGIDSLILGCTHYPLLLNCISSAAGKDIQIVNPANATAKMLKSYLTKHHMLKDPKENKGVHQFFVSDNTDKFGSICSVAIGKSYDAVKIDIENY